MLDLNTLFFLQQIVINEPMCCYDVSVESESGVHEGLTY
jgi:hypothetical protein